MVRDNAALLDSGLELEDAAPDRNNALKIFPHKIPQLSCLESARHVLGPLDGAVPSDVRTGGTSTSPAGFTSAGRGSFCPCDSCRGS